MRPPDHTAEQILGGLATRSHGLVTRRRLIDAGVTAAEIKHRLASGALLREYPGVYRVGHRAPSIETRYLAAVLACGDGALLRGLAAAFLYELVRGPAPRPEVMTVKQRRVKGVQTKRTRALDPRDVASRRGIPITSVARTLVDVAPRLSVARLACACHDASVKYGTTPEDVEEVLVRRPNSPGAAKLRRVLRGDERVTLSALERRFLELLAAAGLPLPATNRRAGRRYVDCRWERPPLTVELDGYRYHSSRHAWEQDRRREREAYARGDDFRRYTYGDVFDHPRAMLAELRALLCDPMVAMRPRSNAAAG